MLVVFLFFSSFSRNLFRQFSHWTNYLVLLPRWKLYFNSRPWTESTKAFRCLTPTQKTGITKLHWELCCLFFTFSVGTVLSAQILSTSPSLPLPAKETPWSFSPEEHVWFHEYWKLPFTVPLIFVPHRRQMGWAVPGRVVSVGRWKATCWAQATSQLCRL